MGYDNKLEVPLLLSACYNAEREYKKIKSRLDVRCHRLILKSCISPFTSPFMSIYYRMIKSKKKEKDVSISLCPSVQFCTEAAFPK